MERRYSHPVDKSYGVRSDQTVILTAIESAKVYPDTLRRGTPHWPVLPARAVPQPPGERTPTPAAFK